MISWQDIQAEVEQETLTNPINALDVVRRNAYKELVTLTGRPLLVYGSAFQNPFKAQFSNIMSIDLTDKDGFAEIIRNIEGKKVDIFIHSPGGSAEATESVVEILRSKFTDVRFIITGTAKSAATMLAMSGNSILMDAVGELGPVDPQIFIGSMFVPAGSLKEEFEKASSDIAEHPENLAVWLPILEKYTPALLVQCDNFIKLSRDLVEAWLKKYMFKSGVASEKNAKAEKIANYLADEKNTLSHARRVDANQLLALNVVLDKVEDQSPEIQDAVKKVHLAIMATLENTNVYKLFESSEDSALIRQLNVQPV